MKPYSRSVRLGKLIQEIISEILEYEVKDKRLRRVSIVRVELSEDLKRARIYYDAICEEEASKGFESAKGFLRWRLAKELEIKTVPELSFHPVELWKDFML